MNITFKKKDIEIKSIKDWEELGHPKSGNQWKDGRSSKEMARFALSERFQEIIAEVLLRCKIEDQEFDCEPEATTSLGKGFNRGGCRNHDLLMKGQNCIIGIEAKVSESFDENISDVINKQTTKYSDTTHTRAYKLIQYFKKDSSVDENSIGYQLFTSMKGTIEEAQKKHVNKCINLILVFTGDVEKENAYEKNCQKNDQDYKDFYKLVGASADGSFSVTEEISCWLKKIKIKISPKYEYEIEEID